MINTPAVAATRGVREEAEGGAGLAWQEVCLERVLSSLRQAGMVYVEAFRVTEDVTGKIFLVQEDKALN